MTDGSNILLDEITEQEIMFLQNTFVLNDQKWSTFSQFIHYPNHFF